MNKAEMNEIMKKKEHKQFVCLSRTSTTTVERQTMTAEKKFFDLIKKTNFQGIQVVVIVCPAVSSLLVCHRQMCSMPKLLRLFFFCLSLSSFTHTHTHIDHEQNFNWSIFVFLFSFGDEICLILANISVWNVIKVQQCAVD